MSTSTPNSARGVYTLPTVAVTTSEALALITVTNSLSDAERMSVVASLVSTLGARPSSHLKAVELVLNIFTLAVPEMAVTVTGVRSLSIRPTSMTRVQLLGWLGIEGDPADAGMITPFVLPRPPVTDALAVTNTAAVYAGVASILFSMGKQATERAQPAALDKRPDALIRRFDLSEADQALLPGRSAGPTRESMEYIYNAYSTYPEIRAYIVRFFLATRGTSDYLPLHLEVLMTNFNLMRGSGMTHVDAILKLSKMHPWCIRVPELEPYWAKFADELTQFQAIPADVRPYHRMLTSQSDFLFVSAEYRPLIAVAGDFMEDVEKTFSGYVYNASKYQDLIAKVRSYAPNYHPTTKLTNLASLLDIPDVPLPARTAPVATPDSTVA